MIMSECNKDTIVVTELRPPITVSAQDHERLSTIAKSAANAMPDVASVLMEELDRANVLSTGMPEHTVRMGSEAEFRDEATGKTRIVTLVYPGEADISRRRISVLTPIGTALIGLSAGQSITWETRVGEIRQLTVLRVREPRGA
jgi:regulator of nucleoside diphosphate kinase